jgi:3-phosphoshikimate 1-carboxyvinyltransferase
MRGVNLAEGAEQDRLEGHRCGPLTGTAEIPGDKSISHRSLIFGGLAVGTTNIAGLLEGDDVLNTAKAVQAFGAEVERIAEGQWRVTSDGQWRSPDAPIDCGNSGTGARLLMGAAAGFPIRATFTGDQSLSSRPMERVLGPLRAMGAKTEGSTLPVTVHGGELIGISYDNIKSSAQVKTAILLAGLRALGEVEVNEALPSRDHTENMLRAFGVDVEQDGSVVRLGRRRLLTGTDVVVPRDPSSAAFPIVAALIVDGSEIELPNILINPLRTGLITTLKEMGGDIEFRKLRSSGGEQVADIVVRASSLRGVDVPAERAPSMIDEYPILGIAAACASGTTVMRGLAELRVKESDRLAAVANGLRACGVEVEEGEDSLTVHGNGRAPVGGGDVAAHHDHRIAMSFLILGLVAERPVAVDSAGMIATSFPTFVPLMRDLGADIR